MILGREGTGFVERVHLPINVPHSLLAWRGSRRILFCLRGLHVDIKNTLKIQFRDPFLTPAFNVLQF